jgi:hypothetical protein
VRATYATRLERELSESERELHRACDERIEQAVQEAVVAPELGESPQHQRRSIDLALQTSGAEMMLPRHEAGVCVLGDR